MPNIVINNEFWFILVGVLVVMAIIGYLAEQQKNKKTTKKEEKSENIESKKKEIVDEVEDTEEEEEPTMEELSPMEVSQEEQVEASSDTEIEQSLEIPTAPLESSLEIPTTSSLESSLEIPTDTVSQEVTMEMDENHLEEASAPTELETSLEIPSASSIETEPVQTEVISTGMESALEVSPEPSSVVEATDNFTPSYEDVSAQNEVETLHAMEQPFEIPTYHAAEMTEPSSPLPTYSPAEGQGDVPNLMSIDALREQLLQGDNNLQGNTNNQDSERGV